MRTSDKIANDDTTMISFKAQVNMVKHSRNGMAWAGLIAGAVILLGGGGYLVYHLNQEQQQQAEQIQKAQKKMDLPSSAPQ
jgi:hypothetical protein